MNTKWILPKELTNRNTIVERTDRGKALTYGIAQVVNNCCSAPNSTHVLTDGGAVWCYDNSREVEVIA